MGALIALFIFVILLFVVIAVILGIFMMSTYNKLVKLNNKVQNSWANIDAQLQRRFDLIPNLVETVKGCSAHQKQLLDNFVLNRDNYVHANSNVEKLNINAELSSNLKTLYSTLDEYPQLKANKNFLQLQSALAEIEEDITYARQFYNDSVTIYNNAIMMFPNKIIASMFGMKEEKLFDALSDAEKAPQIQMRETQYKTCPKCGASVSHTQLKCEYCGCNLLN